MCRIDELGFTHVACGALEGVPLFATLGVIAYAWRGHAAKILGPIDRAGLWGMAAGCGTAGAGFAIGYPLAFPDQQRLAEDFYQGQPQRTITVIKGLARAIGVVGLFYPIARYVFPEYPANASLACIGFGCGLRYSHGLISAFHASMQRVDAGHAVGDEINLCFCC